MTCLFEQEICAIVACDLENGIGKEGKIPWKSYEDLKYFKEITSKNDFNVNNFVIMGKKTWDSIPVKLTNRSTIVLSVNNRPCLEYPPNSPDYYAEDVQDALRFIKKSIELVHSGDKNLKKSKIFVIGGEQIYKAFLPFTSKIYRTRVMSNFECDTFFPQLEDDEWKQKIIRESEKNSFSLRWEELTRINKHEKVYLDTLKNVFENGHKRSDRTGTGTISLFSPPPMRFDISKTVPLLTTKKVPWKSVVEELLWFLRGDTDASILREKKVRIWDKNTSRDFLDKRGLDYKEGLLGPGYGWQWRRFGEKYDEKLADSRQIPSEHKGDGFDQIAYIEDCLKNDPLSRRIYLNAWNAKDLDKMALVPCHVSVQFYVDEKKAHFGGVNRYLSAHVYIRSNDLFLGNPWNILSYSVLTYILAKRHDMHPKDLIVTIGDAHIYNDHIDKVQKQLERLALAEPKLNVSDRVKNINISDITIDDFSVENYVCKPAISAQMSA